MPRIICGLAVVVLTWLAAQSPSVAQQKAKAVTAVEVAKLYATDPKAFNATYADKVVELVGVVRDPAVEQTLEKTFVVTLNGFKKAGDPVETIIVCKFGDGSKTKLPKVQKGQQVKVRGMCQPHKDSRYGAVLHESEIVK